MIGGIGETDIKREVHSVALENLPLNNYGVISDGVLRNKIADFEMDEEIFDLTIQRVTDEAKTGNNSGALSSFFKFYGTCLLYTSPSPRD